MGWQVCSEEVQMAGTVEARRGEPYRAPERGIGLKSAAYLQVVMLLPVYTYLSALTPHLCGVPFATRLSLSNRPNPNKSDDSRKPWQAECYHSSGKLFVSALNPIGFFFAYHYHASCCSCVLSDK